MSLAGRAEAVGFDGSLKTGTWQKRMPHPFPSVMWVAHPFPALGKGGIRTLHRVISGRWSGEPTAMQLLANEDFTCKLLIASILRENFPYAHENEEF